MTDSIVPAELIERKIYLIRNKKVLIIARGSNWYSAQTEPVKERLVRDNRADGFFAVIYGKWRMRG